MEDWKIDFEWLQIRHKIKAIFDKDSLPDLQAILFLIGVQELGQGQRKFSKEEKQDLMHIAVCQLLEPLGYYELEGRDQDGWPHYKLLKAVDTEGVASQAILLKEQIVHYFKEEKIT